MNFDQCIAQIEALSGQTVEVEVAGKGADGAHFAEFWGRLQRMGEVEFSEEHAAILAEAVVETAVVFIVGEGTLSLMPSRFVSCAPKAHREEWLEVETLDARVLIGPKRPAWFD